MTDKTAEQKALAILRVLGQVAADGGSLTIAQDWGFGSAIVINDDGAHTHIGDDSCDDEQRSLEAFVNGLHDLLIEKRGLSWVKGHGELRDELDALRAFAQEVMEVWPYGDLDGGTLQDAATKHGLLKPEIRHEPCGEGCACTEHATSSEFESGVECFRKTALLKGEPRQPAAWLVRSKTGLVRAAWITPPTKEQLAVAECDGDTVTPLCEC